MTLSYLQIPRTVAQTVSFGEETWKISLYKDALPHFRNDNNNGWDPEILKQLEIHAKSHLQHNYRVQLHLKTVPFLVGFLFDQKEIVITSTRMSREIFLLQELEKHSLRSKLSGELRDDVEALKKHLQKMASIVMSNAPTILEQKTNQYGLPDFLANSELSEIASRAKRLEEELLEVMHHYKKTWMERISDLVLHWVATYAILRIHLLKFIAILPSLQHDYQGKEWKRILLETCRRILEDSKIARTKEKSGEARPLSPFLNSLVQAAFFFCRAIPARLLTLAIRYKTLLVAKRFITGESVENTSKALRKLAETDRDATLVQLGELIASEKEADHYLAEVLKIIRGFALHVARGEKNRAGIYKANTSIKVSALAASVLFNPQAPEKTYNIVAPRLRKILLEAKREKVFVTIDAEHYSFRDLVFYIYRRVLLETEELRDFQATGIVIQAYLRDAYPHFQEVLTLVKGRGIPMPIRLVKGAYWDAETIEARAHAYDPPEFLNKEETDLHFRQLIYKTLEAAPHLQLCLGSHNLSDHAFAETLRTEKFPQSPPIEHQCLHMTYEALSYGMAEIGWASRNYVTVGNLLEGMAYLVRRIMENSSQVGILTQMRLKKEEFNMDFPHTLLLRKKEEGKIVRDSSVMKLKPYFVNAIPIRLFLKEERKWVDRAFEQFSERELEKDYSSNNFSGDLQAVYSPSHPEKLVGKIQLATVEEANQTVETAHQAYLQGNWAKSHPLERGSILLRAADLLLLRRLFFTALVVHEGGKTFGEAIADVNEAIDFFNFYAREEVRITQANQQLASRGLFAVISPWNFPLAIPAGMTASALVAGNAVLLKPAEHTPLITQKLTELLHEAGVPKEILIHLPGHGSTVGKTLVEHPKIHGVVFTGSKKIGMWIAHTAGKKIKRNPLFDYEAPSRVITEMGGKNAMVVTNNADLDEAIAAILYSAFGNAGQKCSACSRVLVDDAVKEKFMKRFKEACRDIPVGPAQDHFTLINPLIAYKEKERLKQVTKDAIQEANLFGGCLLLDRSQENLPGHCMGPVLLELPAERATHPDSFAMNELFGPILHIIGYSDLEEATRLFNAPDYGLTGGIFAQSQDTLTAIQKKLQAGNIYVNRSCTGARVAIEPFGGFKLSGTGPKAGSTVYLDAFHIDLKSVKANGEQTIAIDREGIEKFKTFIANSLPHFIRHRYWNRKIPGQMSFNDFSQVKEKGFYLALEEKPNLKTLLYFLAALAVGSKVTILCPNAEIFATWAEILEFLYESGFQKEEATVKQFDLNLASTLIHQEDPYFLILEGNSRMIEAVLQEVYDDRFDEKHMKTILTSLDAPALNDFGRYLEQFVQVRSFAINTMRYGAPMELEL